MPSLKDKVAGGMLWSAIGSGAQQVIGLIFGIILGRLLVPEDYGLMAMIMVFAYVATAIQNSGFSTAIANLPRATAEDYNSVFWFCFLAGLVLYAILWTAAPWIAAYYHEPRLVGLSRYVFLCIPLSGTGMAQAAWLFREVKAREQAVSVAVGITVSSIVGVVMALCGCAYWALATQTLAYIAVQRAVIIAYCPWRPTFHIDFGPARRMFRFSCKVMATAVLGIININILNILLGRYFSPHATGEYNQAYQWDSKAFSLVGGMVQQVAQPVLASLGGERERQLAVLRKMMRFTAFITFPLLFGLALVAHEFITVTITDKWAASATLLQILCVSGAAMPLSTLLSNAILSHGRSDIYMWATVALGIAEIAVMLTIWPLGIKTMVMAYTALNILWIGIWQYYIRRLTGYRFRHMLADTLPFALVSAAVMTATHYLTAPLTSPWALLGSRIVAAGAMYYIIMRVLGVQMLRECQEYFIRKLRRRGIEREAPASCPSD